MVLINKFFRYMEKVLHYLTLECSCKSYVMAQILAKVLLVKLLMKDVIDDIKAWQNRPLESLYPIVYFDCIVVKVRQDKRIINKSVYIALGVDL